MIDRVYIKMSQALPREIKDLWEPKVGDLVYNELTKEVEVITDITYAFQLINHLTYLRRQEDLQEIAENKDKLLPSLQELKKYFKKLSFTEMGIKIPMKWVDWWNVLWLCFVMKTCYQKKWDNNKEEWVEL